MLRTLPELKALLPPGRRLMGLDLGSRTIGLAVSDPGLIVASPIGTIRRTNLADDVRELGRFMIDRDVGGLVLGLPINMNGSEGPAAEAARTFAQKLIDRASMLGGEPEIAFWDERMSTVAVTRLMLDADMSRKRRSQVVDKMAAAYILQSALDSLGRSPSP